MLPSSAITDRRLVRSADVAGEMGGRGICTENTAAGFRVEAAPVCCCFSVSFPFLPWVCVR